MLNYLEENEWKEKADLAVSTITTIVMRIGTSPLNVYFLRKKINK